MAWASTLPLSGEPASNPSTWAGLRAFRPFSVSVNSAAAESPAILTAIAPPRGMAFVARTTRLRRSLTLFFGRSARGPSHQKRPLVVVEHALVALPGVAEVDRAPAEPAAPKASRANCS